MPDEMWFAIYQLSDGALYSTGTVIASAEVLAENGLAVAACPAGMNPQDGTWQWDAKKRKFAAIKITESE